MIDPHALKYTPTHEWVHLEGDLATVGISRFAVDQLTDLIVIDLAKASPGATLTAGRPFGEVESVKAVSDLYSPVSGEVVEVNSAVASNVQLLAEDPYDKGWLLKIKLSNPDEVAAMMDFATYEAKVAEDPH